MKQTQSLGNALELLCLDITKIQPTALKKNLLDIYRITKLCMTIWMKYSSVWQAGTSKLRIDQSNGPFY